MNKFLWTLVVGLISLATVSHSMKQEEVGYYLFEPKVASPAEDATRATFTYLPDWQEFQVSFIHNPLIMASNTHLLFGIPVVGHYLAHEYNFRKRLALIQADPKFLSLVLPEEAKKALAYSLDTPLSKLFDVLKKSELSLNVLALGKVLDENQDSPNTSYNLVFHPWVGLWHSQDDSMNYFAETIALGIFDADGILPTGDIALNNLAQTLISWHEPKAISPDIARVALDSNCSYSGFWALAVSEDKKHINCSYFLLANNDEAELLLATALNKAKNIYDLDAALITAVTGAFSDLPLADKKALEKWINIIFTLAGD